MLLWLSTVMQKVADVHDTEVSWLPVSMDVGADHIIPFQESTLPTLSTAMQEDDEHDMSHSRRVRARLHRRPYRGWTMRTISP